MIKFDFCINEYHFYWAEILRKKKATNKSLFFEYNNLVNFSCQTTRQKEWQKY
jgi:hypothetical protein